MKALFERFGHYLPVLIVVLVAITMSVIVCLQSRRQLRQHKRPPTKPKKNDRDRSTRHIISAMPVFQPPNAEAEILDRADQRWLEPD